VSTAASCDDDHRADLAVLKHDQLEPVANGQFVIAEPIAIWS
jgi:hypothetical protein